MRKATSAESSISERPISYEPRRLAEWINPTGAKKVHSLVDKVYKQTNLHMAWLKVKENNGSGGVDNQTILDFEGNLTENLQRLHDELKNGTYKAEPVRQHKIPKAGQPGKFRKLGIPTIYDRVCQQALKNRLEPIFEATFDEASFGYRQGRSTKDALRKVWKELESGNCWIVDADLEDFFGTADHEKVLTLLNQQVSDGSVLKLVKQMLKAGCMTDVELVPTETGVPQGGVVSPLISNVLLTPFDKEMRRMGYSFTRYADDWIVTCKTLAEAQAALKFAGKVLTKLGVKLHPNKTRIVHVIKGFEFLGFKIKRGGGSLRLSPDKISGKTKAGMIYAYPKDQSIKGFMDKVRLRTKRKAGISTWQLVQDLNPLIRGWGIYYCKANVRKLFARLKGWIIRRIWSHRFKRWANTGWKKLPDKVLYEKYGLVKLTSLIPSLQR
ncbi:group II intron reverse transcriptase/maturase [Pedobacter panaciterrae]|uniref:Group II intron reverse transcriptase/maturase n=1 Tax=Pedobacter panaciterrae TaxID=363849 RepID=A0ABU8NHG3_9SPHI